MRSGTQSVRHVLGAVLLGGLGGAMFGALIGLIFADVLAWWARGSVIIAVTVLAGLAGIVASAIGVATDPIEDEA